MRIAALIFAKYPEPGAVKTRMVPPLSPHEAAALHSAALTVVCEQVRSHSVLEPALIVTPDHRTGDFARRFADSQLPCWPQGDGDLGQRLLRAVGKAFDADVDGVLLLGADSPTLPFGYLQDAVAMLADHDMVLGPSEDGGYYLLGLRRTIPALFDGIDWGGSKVADQTRHRAIRAGINPVELPVWYDLDRFDDLCRARCDLDRLDGPVNARTAPLRRLIASYVERYSDGRNDRAADRAVSQSGS